MAWHAQPVVEAVVNKAQKPGVASGMSSKGVLFTLGSWALTSALWVAPCAHAQAPVHEQPIEDLLPLANDPNDPIGLDRDHAELDRAAAAGPAHSADAGTGPPAKDAPRFGPTPPLLVARTGEVLSAASPVHETSHALHVELEAGLAIVTHELVLDSTSDRPAEAALRIAVPDATALLSLSVCNSRGCREGLPDKSAPAELGAYDDAVQARGVQSLDVALPLAHVRLRSDEHGAALWLRAAAIWKAHALTVRVRYRVPAPLHGGVVRVRLPARGMDPRIVRASLTLHATDLIEPRIGGLLVGREPVWVETWSAIELSAREQPTSHTTVQLLRFACGDTQCLHAYAQAGPEPAELRDPVDAVLAVDASPSMEGPARTRLLVTLAAIIDQLPEGSRVRALMFAGTAAPLAAQRSAPGALAMNVFAPTSFDVELGSATRFEAAWQMISSWGFESRDRRARKKLVVIIGDGGLTTGTTRPFAAARRAGVEVSAVVLADRHASSALAQGIELARGTLIEAGAEANLAVRGIGNERIEERVAALFVRNASTRNSLRVLGRTLALPRLRAGESIALDMPLPAAHASAARKAVLSCDARRARAAHETKSLGSLASGLAAVDPHDLAHPRGDRPAGQDRYAKKPHAACDRRGPALRRGGLSFDLAPVSLAEGRARCITTEPKPPEAVAPEEGVGMPSSPLLSMLRQRIMPVARGCFRRDRAGRADYQVRATFTFRLAEREVIAADIEGQIAAPLRACLLAAVDTLAVPRFSGVVIVRYPLVTEREPLPSQVELTTETARTLDALTPLAQGSPH